MTMGGLRRKVKMGKSNKDEDDCTVYATSATYGAPTGQMDGGGGGGAGESGGGFSNFELKRRNLVADMTARCPKTILVIPKNGSITPSIVFLGITPSCGPRLTRRKERSRGGGR